MPTAPANSAPGAAEILADFEGPSTPAEFFTFFGASTVNATAIAVADSDPLARPGQSGTIGVLQVDYNVVDFGGFGQSFQVAGPQDWSNFTSFDFWFYGTASGLTYQAEISDNRSDPNTDTSERFDFQFTDTIPGWQYISIPFEDFTRATDFQPGGAPDDGFTLTEIWAWTIVLPNGADTVYFDDIALGLRVIDDFESGLPSGFDVNGTPIGFYTFSDGASAIGIATTTTPPAPVPGSASGNNVLAMTVDVVGFAGFIHGFENAAVDTWVPQDWSAFEGFSVWVYGTNTGTTLFIDVLDNRNPGSTSDDAERFTVTFVDDFTGWQMLEFPFSSFQRKEVGNGAPNDGFTLTEVHGWALGALRAPGEVTFYVDNAYLQVSPAADSDGDGVPDNGDLCPDTAGGAAVDSKGCADEQVDRDGDGACDPGAASDGPSMCTGTDAFPDDPDETSDNDGDGTGDNADTDDDNDGQLDADETLCGSDPLDSGSVSPDADNDGIPDCVDSDDDNDGVDDSIDQCASTVIPDSVPTSSRGLGSNRWTLDNADGSFTQGPPQSGRTLSFTTTDTKGCSCEQIIAGLGLGEGHSKFGCSTSAMMDWINRQ
jgi:hypothetical protein